MPCRSLNSFADNSSLALASIVAPHGNSSFQKPKAQRLNKATIIFEARAPLNSPQQLETFQGFVHLGKMSNLFSTFQRVKKTYPYIQNMSAILCSRKLLILFTSVIIINKKLLFLLECQMRHKKQQLLPLHNRTGGGEETRVKKKNPLISLALKSLRHKTENFP